MFTADANMDNVHKTIEEARDIDVFNLKEEKNMSKKLDKALFVWLDMDGTGKMNHRFEKTMNGRWFDWSTHISYTIDGFLELLKTKVEGKEFDVYYG